MSAPTVPQTAEHLYEELGVAQPYDESLNWPFLILLAGLATSMGELPDIVRDTDDGPGWSVVVDPARAPVFALPWLAQFAGVALSPDGTDDDHRAEITSPPRFQRGTREAMIAAAQRSGGLTGDMTVLITERDGGPYKIGVTTVSGETSDSAKVLRALLTQKPAGLTLTLNGATGTNWSQATPTWAAAVGSWTDTLTTPP